LQFSNARNGWAYTLGFYGGIHTTTGGDAVWLTGIQQVSAEAPTKFELYQNYPNPFNPVTKIEYDVKRQTSNVRLMVFDITGREIKTLVNQKQKPGTYMVDFSGNGYSSGVYFYTLFIDDRAVDTKKMLLIK
jgi:hypothetical protein